MKWFAWIFWTAAYAFRKTPADFQAHLLKGIRLRAPWWKFKPFVFRNEDGKQWEAWWGDEPSYAEIICGGKNFRGEVHRSQTTNKIVGITVYDERPLP